MHVSKRVKRNSTRNVTRNVTNSWGEALRDAEIGLEKAQRAVASWKATIQTCRKKAEENAAWPGKEKAEKADALPA